MQSLWVEQVTEAGTVEDISVVESSSELFEPPRSASFGSIGTRRATARHPVPTVTTVVRFQQCSARPGAARPIPQF